MGFEGLRLRGPGVLGSGHRSTAAAVPGGGGLRRR
jgi:hypothetical protein